MSGKNVANVERALRAVVAVGLLVGATQAPWSLAVRLGALVAPALYLLGTALAGTCLGYRLMGVSTCPVSESR